MLFKKIAYFLLTFSFLAACKHEVKKGKDLSSREIDYLRKLNLLDSDESVVLFDSQSDLETSGNFFTEKRIAAYWIDNRDSSKTSINFAFYDQIDSLLFKDRSKSLTYASYLIVKRKDGNKFKVFIDGDRAEATNFFSRANKVFNQFKSGNRM